MDDPCRAGESGPGPRPIKKERMEMVEKIWNEKGEAYQIGGRIISIEQARNEGRAVDHPFGRDGTGYLRDGVIYPNRD